MARFFSPFLAGIGEPFTVQGAFLSTVYSVQLVSSHPLPGSVGLFLHCVQKEEGEGSPHDEKPVKVNYEASNYDKDLVAMIERDMVQRNPNVRWYVRGGAGWMWA